MLKVNSKDIYIPLYSAWILVFLDTFDCLSLGNRNGTLCNKYYNDTAIIIPNVVPTNSISIRTITC